MIQTKLKCENLKDVEYENINNNKLYLFLKRVMDIVGSILGLIILAPIFLILIICVKYDSKGPVFFSHKRLGYSGNPIRIYKFRTMVTNAEELLNDLSVEQKREFEENFKLENDPRITKFGNLLRKSSLDELPQLLNILKGELSIVGPRPIVEKEIENYGVYGDKLLMVKPGLTGNWQANGRSDTTYEERVQMDMEYIDNRNIWMDIKIIFKTFTAVIKKQGAR
ncbi:MAG: sugar transferase [Clostridium sp.]